MDTNEVFKEKLEYGRLREIEIAKIFIEKGYAVLPLSQFKGIDHAPIISWKNEVINDEIIAPDLVCFSKERTFFVEVKSKKQWVKFNNNVETGINLKHYNEYKALKNLLGNPIYIIFMQEIQDEGIFFIEIDDEYNRVWDGKTYNKQQKISPPLVLWNKNQLKKLITKPILTP